MHSSFFLHRARCTKDSVLHLNFLAHAQALTHVGHSDAVGCHVPWFVPLARKVIKNNKNVNWPASRQVATPPNSLPTLPPTLPSICQHFWYRKTLLSAGRNATEYKAETLPRRQRRQNACLIPNTWTKTPYVWVTHFCKCSFWFFPSFVAATVAACGGAADAAVWCHHSQKNIIPFGCGARSRFISSPYSTCAGQPEFLHLPQKIHSLSVCLRPRRPLLLSPHNLTL